MCMSGGGQGFLEKHLKPLSFEMPFPAFSKQYFPLKRQGKGKGIEF